MAHLRAAGEPAAERTGGRDKQQAPVVLDSVSRHIIDQLQQDGRRSPVIVTSNRANCRRLPTDLVCVPVC